MKRTVQNRRSCGKGAGTRTPPGVTSKKVAEKKIKIVEKLLQEWLKNKKLNFYSMLGAYSDKKNLGQLHSFEEDEGEEIKLMLVINKLTEGKHVKIKRRSGVILLRELDE